VVENERDELVEEWEVSLRNENGAIKIVERLREEQEENSSDTDLDLLDF
jgi:putative component of toxin-antitoxin plasmid stabilization module